MLIIKLIKKIKKNIVKMIDVSNFDIILPRFKTYKR